MKKCPVCEFLVEKNTTICPQCKWNKLGNRLNTTDEERAELERARSAWQAKKAKETRRKEPEVDPRLSENLPYYDFILVGHSSVGKTTYLAMLCEQGGNKNIKWNFKPYGDANKLGKNAPKSIREKATSDVRLIDTIINVSDGTLSYINGMVKKIRQQDGKYSNINEQKLVFSFRPTDVKDEYTLLTLDYPGEWISVEKGQKEGALQSKKRMEQFSNYLNLSQSLIIMIDPLIFLKSDFKEESFHTRGLAKAASQLLKGKATDKRPIEFVKVEKRQMPVAIIINKYDLLNSAHQEKKISEDEFKNPEIFLKEKCHNVLNDVSSFTDNWKPFFVSCYGMDQPLVKLNEQGLYTPPANPNPFDLEKPLDWLYEQTQRRAKKDALL